MRTENFLANKLQELGQIEQKRISVMDEIVQYGYEIRNFPLSQKYMDEIYKSVSGSSDVNKENLEKTNPLVLINKAKIDTIVNPKDAKKIIDFMIEKKRSFPMDMVAQINYMKLFFDFFTEGERYVWDRKEEYVINTKEGAFLMEIARSISEKDEFKPPKSSLTDIQTAISLSQILLDFSYGDIMFKYVNEVEKKLDGSIPPHIKNVIFPILKLHKDKVRGNFEYGYMVTKNIFDRFNDQSSLKELLFYAYGIGRMQEFWEKSERYGELGNIINAAAAAGLQRVWNAEGIRKAKRLAIVTDQGFGDNIQNMRFVEKFLDFLSSELSLNNFKIVAYKEVYPLFQKLFPGVELVPYNQEEMAARFDSYIYFSDMARAMRLERKDFEAEPIMKEFRKKEGDGKRKIGIVWKTYVRDYSTKNRSFQLEDFFKKSKVLREALKSEDTEIYSFVKDDISEDEEKFMKENGVVPFPENIQNFLQTAELAGKMDEFHLIDTAMTHIAGSIGVPTTMYVNRYRDQRWGKRSDQGKYDDTIWYGSLKIFNEPYQIPED